MTTFQVISGYECLNACLLNHMRQQGITEFSASDMFFLGEGYSICYEKGSKTHIFSSAYDSNFRFMDKVRINYRCSWTLPYLDNLQKVLEMPHLLSICCSSGYLRYRSVFKQSENSLHYINVVDYDDKKNKFLIHDGHVPTNDLESFCGWVDEGEIIRAWEASGGEYIQFDFSDMERDESALSRYRIAMNEYVKKSFSRYLRGEKHRCSDLHYGEDAFITMLNEFSESLSLKFNVNMVRRLNYELRVNGFIGSKFFVLNRFRDKEYEQIVKEWNEWCVMLLELPERYSEKKLVAFKDKAMEICKRERVWMEGKLYN